MCLVYFHHLKTGIHMKKKKKRKKEKKNGGPKDLYSNLLVDTGLNTSSKKKSSNTGLAIILAKNEVKNI